MFAHIRQRWTESALLLAAAASVFLPTLRAQNTPGGLTRPAAKVIFETGQVSLLKDGYPVVLNVGDMIQVKQTIMTGPDGYAKFQLEDNTIWEVFGNSKVVFHDNYPSWMDWLYVQIGRVKIFEQHTKGEDSKKVTTPTAVISVRGTIYDVVVEDEDGTTFVTVDDGAVDVSNRTYPGSSVTLNSGDSIRVFRGQPLIARQVDHAAIMRVLLKAARDAANTVLINRPGAPVGVPGGGPAPGGQGNHTGQPGSGTGTGTTNGAPPPPTSAPTSH